MSYQMDWQGKSETGKAQVLVTDFRRRLVFGWPIVRVDVKQQLFERVGGSWIPVEAHAPIGRRVAQRLKDERYYAAENLAAAAEDDE